jgi:hypothetical protein
MKMDIFNYLTIFYIVILLLKIIFKFIKKIKKSFLFF